MKLTDTQLMLLSAASQREDGGLELLPNLKGGACQKVVGKLLREGLIEEIPARGSLAVWRRYDEKGPLALSITQRGLAAIQVDEGGAQSKARKPARVGKRPISRLCKETRAEAPQRSAKPHRGESKQARVIAMLQSRQGATIAAIMKATGWQPHSVRGFLTAVVRNKLGLTLVSEKTGEQRVYRIMAKAAPARRGSNPGAKAA